MSSNNFITGTDTLQHEGEQLTVSLTRTSSNTLQLNWAFPSEMRATAGALLLVSEQQMNPSNRPSNTALYTPSADLLAPADTIGANSYAQVVGAFYDDVTTTSLTITNADPTKLYYASVHAVTNVRQYFQDGRFSYIIDAFTNSYLSRENASGDIPQSVDAPLNATLGQVWYNPVSNTVSMYNGSAWIPAGVGTVHTGSKIPTNPVTGSFFYDSNTGELTIFDGASWTKANTANQGMPMYAKPGVGTDNTLDERAAVVNTLKLMLGWPTVCLELTEDHFNMAINESLSEFRHRADNAYTKEYILFDLVKAQSLYYLNDPVMGTNRTVDVIKVHRLNALGAYTSNDSGIYAQTFLNQIMSPAPVDMVSIHLLANMGKELERLFAGNLMFTWHEGSRQLMIQRKIQRNEKVILETVAERTEQDLMVDRWAKSWIKNWAYARLLEVLGGIRSKFSNGLPGAGGGISLNGSELLSRADAKFEELKLLIDNFEVGNNSPDHSLALLIG